MIAELLWTAPELLRGSGGSRKASFKGDVFSLGIILQEVLTQGPPYSSWGLSAEGTCPPCQDSLDLRLILQLSSHPTPPHCPVPEICTADFQGISARKVGQRHSRALDGWSFNPYGPDFCLVPPKSCPVDTAHFRPGFREPGRGKATDIRSRLVSVPHICLLWKRKTTQRGSASLVTR